MSQGRDSTRYRSSMFPMPHECSAMLSIRHLLRIQMRLVSASLLLAVSSSVLSADETSNPESRNLTQLLQQGRLVYKEQCAACHGARGEGVPDAYADRLIGDATVGELAKLISNTMPKDEANLCVGENAQAVAEYIHHEFYSEAAQIRNRPPRIGIARLTANQLRNSTADLYAHFGGVPGVTNKRGVKAIYFNGARWKNENKKIERVDPVIDFDFGHDSPGEGIEATSFYIYWEGGLRADTTGRHEIIIRSTCSFVMDFGRLGRRLIDNHVQSGDKTEFREVLTLTAGRVYPFKIDFIQRKRKTELPPARISMSWIPPHGVQQVIPERNLIPSAPPATFSLQTILPPDDRSYGYERGIAVNREWDQSTTIAALEFADIAAQELWPQFERRRKNKDNANREKLRSFLTEVVTTAFRGPLTEELQQTYVDQQLKVTPDDTEAIRRVCLLALKSPRFLYPLADSHQSLSQQVANRLALVLHDSLPSNEWLLKQIADNKLQDEAAIRAAAKRMLNDYRTHAKTRDMLHAWLNLDHLTDIHKDQAKFPDFDAALVSDLRTSLDLFLDDIVWSDDSDFRRLILADTAWTTERIASFYGDAWKPASESNADFHRTSPDSNSRLGLVNHPFLMSGLAYHDSTSPIHRGVFLIRYILGRTLRPPSEAFTPLSPDLHPDLTTRERVDLQTSPTSCQVCHTRINGLGFTLENFDAVGRYREQEREKPIDPAGSYTDRSGKEVTFRAPQDLAEFLASSDDVHQAFVNRVFQHFVKQPPAAYGASTLKDLTDHLRSNDYHIQDLIVEIAVVAASQPLTQQR